MNIYFSGIGGVGIGPLAEIAADAGYQVVGSDQQESLMTEQLRHRGIIVNTNQDGTFLQETHSQQPVDWLVYTAALPDSHPELIVARQLGIKIAKRDELLAHIISEKNLKLLAVAGTHGKTTTSGMLTWALMQLGVPVSYSIGTTLSFGPSGKFDPTSQYFVYECDEFDRNFLHFSPHLSLITSIDYDHFDTYPTEAEYLAAFEQFGEQSEQLIAWQDQHVELFTNPPDAWLLDETLPVQLAGNHNRRNASLVLKALEKLGLPGNHQSSVETFPGTNRRFERLAENIYSDYGHHPVEIAATLQMARELSDNVVLVYQPHQNIRQHEIRNQYTNQFELAEKIYWLPTYLSRENPDLEILSPRELTANITNRSATNIVELDDELWQNLKSDQSAGKLILAMGAGSIDAWLRSKLK
jgi:UDP-N-acetylmuramate--alanine ligase